MADQIIKQEELLRILNLRQVLAEVERTLAQAERDVVASLEQNGGAVERGPLRCGLVDTFGRRRGDLRTRLEIMRVADRFKATTKIPKHLDIGALMPEYHAVETPETASQHAIGVKEPQRKGEIEVPKERRPTPWGRNVTLGDMGPAEGKAWLRQNGELYGEGFDHPDTAGSLHGEDKLGLTDDNRIDEHASRLAAFEPFDRLLDRGFETGAARLGNVGGEGNLLVHLRSNPTEDQRLALGRMIQNQGGVTYDLEAPQGTESGSAILPGDFWRKVDQAFGRAGEAGLPKERAPKVGPKIPRYEGRLKAEDVPSRLYHLTNTSNLASIERQGLRAARDEALLGSPADRPGVNTVHSQDNELIWEPTGSDTWVEIDTSGLDRSKFQHLGGGWVRYEGDVPSSAIKNIKA